MIFKNNKGKLYAQKVKNLLWQYLVDEISYEEMVDQLADNGIYLWMANNELAYEDENDLLGMIPLDLELLFQTEDGVYLYAKLNEAKGVVEVSEVKIKKTG